MEMYGHAFQINKKKNNNDLEKCFHQLALFFLMAEQNRLFICLKPYGFLSIIYTYYTMNLSCFMTIVRSYVCSFKRHKGAF